MLNEEFDRSIDLDSDPVWTWSDGALEEGQVRFVKEQIRFGDGKMKIIVQPNYGIRTQPCSHAEVGVVSNMPLVSGELRTRHNQFRYGRYEVTMKAPEVQPGNPNINGNFIAAMFVYKDGRFEEWREILGWMCLALLCLFLLGAIGWSKIVASYYISYFRHYCFWGPKRIQGLTLK